MTTGRIKMASPVEMLFGPKIDRNIPLGSEREFHFLLALGDLHGDLHALDGKRDIHESFQIPVLVIILFQFIQRDGNRGQRKLLVQL